VAVQSDTSANSTMHLMSWPGDVLQEPSGQGSYIWLVNRLPL
jgi:hypothetical protein